MSRSNPVYEPDNPNIEKTPDGHRKTARFRDVRKQINARYNAKLKVRSEERARAGIEEMGGLLLPLALEPSELPVIAGERLEPIRWAAFVAYATHASPTRAHEWLASKGYVVSWTQFYRWLNEPWMRGLVKEHLAKNQDQFNLGLAQLKEQGIEVAREILSGARSEDRSVNAQSQLFRALMESGASPAINRQKQITINNQTNVGVAVTNAVDIDKMRRELSPDQIARMALPDAEIPREYRRADTQE